MLILIVSSGPDKGRVYELFDDSTVVLGREGDQVQLADRRVSRQHARLWSEDGQWSLCDLDSRHGTFHNNRPVGRSPVTLADGDRIRIGETRMVLARIPQEHLERVQLLGEPASERQARRAVGSNRASRKVAFAIAAAIVVAVGLNVAVLIQSSASTRQLREQIAAVDPSTGADAQVLSEILARLDQQEDRDAALAEIRSALAEQPDPRAALDVILARIEAKSSQWLTLAEMRDTLDRQRVASDETRAALANVLTRLDQPTGPAVDAQAHDKLDQVLARLDTPQVAPLDPAALAQQVAHHVTAQWNEAAGNNQALMQQLAASFEQQRQLAGQIAELRELIAGQPQATRQALDAALADLATRQDTEAVTAALDQVRAAMPTDVADKLDRVLSQLDEHVTPQQVAAALESAVQRTEHAQQAAMDELRQTVAQLAEAQRATPEAILVQMRAALAERTDAESRLAELVELAHAQPRGQERVERLLEQVLTELRAQPERPADEVLAHVLRELRGKAIASMDELRQTIRTELDARLINVDAAPPGPAATELAATEPRPRILGDLDPDAATPQRISMTSALLGTDASAAGGDEAGLSRIERAYKLAYETGQSVTIGAGQVNPMTGQISEGRTLDPVAAKAAGIKSWREWYLMDDFAERMRLQQQAMRHRQNSTSDPDLITLPEPTNTDARR